MAQQNIFSTPLGERYATINLHYMLHLPNADQQLNTCYEFESATKN